MYLCVGGEGGIDGEKDELGDGGSGSKEMVDVAKTLMNKKNTAAF